MRRFVCLAVPEPVRRALSTAVAPVAAAHGDALRWTRSEGWHVTLAFLGEVPDDDVAAVVERIHVALDRTAPPRRLVLEGAGRFGRNLLWAGVRDDPDGSVAALGDAVQRSLDDASLPVQLQTVRPHVTLARSRRTAGRAVTESLVRSVEVPDVAWDVERVELWRSHLGDGPARYEVDAIVPLP